MRTIKSTRELLLKKLKAPKKSALSLLMQHMSSIKR